MKKIILVLLLFPIVSNSQKLIGGKNIIKTNLTSYLLNNYNITYERAVFKKCSFSIGFRYMPKTSLPFQDKIEEAIGNKDIKIKDFQMGNMAITPEFRVYFGLGKMKGFYIAPYARYASFDLRAPILYDDPYTSGQKDEALFNGKITSFSGGIMFGVQQQIFKKVVLDFWIIGGHYGSSTGILNASFATPLDQNQQDNLNAKLKDIQVNAGPFKFTGEVTSSTTAVINSTGPWAGIRALGFSLGVRF